MREITKKRCLDFFKRISEKEKRFKMITESLLTWLGDDFEIVSDIKTDKIPLSVRVSISSKMFGDKVKNFDIATDDFNVCEEWGTTLCRGLVSIYGKKINEEIEILAGKTENEWHRIFINMISSMCDGNVLGQRWRHVEKEVLDTLNEMQEAGLLDNSLPIKKVKIAQKGETLELSSYVVVNEDTMMGTSYQVGLFIGDMRTSESDLISSAIESFIEYRLTNEKDQGQMKAGLESLSFQSEIGSSCVEAKKDRRL